MSEPRSEPAPVPHGAGPEARNAAKGEPPAAANGYDAFISYSRRDAAFAALLEQTLESYTPPAGLDRPRRRLVAFRDEQDLTGPEYFRAIDAHLAKSRKLILLCSPAARASEYVNDEIRRFARIHGAENIVPVLLSGVPNNAAGEEDADRLAFPDALCELVRMPLAVGYGGFDLAKDRLKRGVFYGAWYTLLANLLDVSRADIEERDRKRRARTRNIWTSGVTTIVVVLTCLTIWAVIERARAIHRGKVTLAGRLAAEARVPGSLDPEAVDQRMLLAIESVRRLDELHEPTADAVATLRDVSTLMAGHVIHLPAGQRDIAWSSDGLHAYVAGDSGVSVIALRSGAGVATLGRAPAAAVFTTAAGGRVGVIEQSGRSTLWDAPGWVQRSELPLESEERARCGALSQDGRYAALLTVRDQDFGVARLSVWTTDSLRLVSTRTLEMGRVEAPDRGACLELAPDYLLARLRPDPASDTMTVALWRWRPDTEPPSSAFSIPGLGPRGPPLRRWTNVVDAAWAADGAELHLVTRDGRLVSIQAAAESRDDARFAGISAVGPAGALLVRRYFTDDPYVPLLRYERIALIDRRTGATQAEIAGDLGTPWLTAGDRRLVTANGRSLRIWRAADGQELMRIDASADVRTVRISPSGRYIATGNADGSLDVWDTAPPGELLQLPDGHAAATSSDSRRIAVGTDRATFVLDVESGASLATVLVRGGLLTFDDSGRFLAASTEDPSRIAFGEPRTIVINLERAAQPVPTALATTAMRFSPDGGALLVGGRDGSVRMTDPGDGKVSWEAKAGTGRVDHLAFSADGEVPVAGVSGAGGSAAVVLYDAEDGRERLRLPRRSSGAFALSGDAALVATVAEAAIEIVRLDDGRVVRRITLPETLRTVRHIAFSADGTRITAIAGNRASIFLGAEFFTEQAVFVWDAATGALLDRLPAAADTASDYTSTLGENDREYFADVAWSNDARFVAALVFENRLSYWAMPSKVTTAELRVWDLSGSSPVETYRARTAPEERLLAIDDSGRLLFTVGDALRVKDTDVSRLLDEACLRVRRDLMPAEWRSHVSEEEPPRPSCPARAAR